MIMDIFSGSFRMTFERFDPTADNGGASLYFLETAGFGHPDGPLIFRTVDGKMIRPASQLHDYDEGSVPQGFCQWEVSPNAWARAYACHDCMYCDHGWYEWDGNLGFWAFMPQVRHAVDVLLMRMAIATGCPVRQAEEMFEGVNLGGGEKWDGHPGPFPALPFLESERAP